MLLKFHPYSIHIWKFCVVEILKLFETIQSFEQDFTCLWKLGGFLYIFGNWNIWMWSMFSLFLFWRVCAAQFRSGPFRFLLVCDSCCVPGGTCFRSFTTLKLCQYVEVAFFPPLLCLTTVTILSELAVSAGMKMILVLIADMMLPSYN
jgi:hypothetical protein